MGDSHARPSAEHADATGSALRSARKTDGHSLKKSPAIQRLNNRERARMASRAVAGSPDPGVPHAHAGTALPRALRESFEQAYAQDFSDVRVHSGAEARRIGAIAYTRGNHLHFQPGRFNPYTASGKELIGHELAHVVQQRAGRVGMPRVQRGTAPIQEHPTLECEADALGHRAARGERVSIQSLSAKRGPGVGTDTTALDPAGPIQRTRDDAMQYVRYHNVFEFKLDDHGGDFEQAFQDYAQGNPDPNHIQSIDDLYHALHHDDDPQSESDEDEPTQKKIKPSSDPHQDGSDPQQNTTQLDPTMAQIAIGQQLSQHQLPDPKDYQAPKTTGLAMDADDDDDEPFSGYAEEAPGQYLHQSLRHRAEDSSGNQKLKKAKNQKKPGKQDTLKSLLRLNRAKRKKGQGRPLYSRIEELIEASAGGDKDAEDQLKQVFAALDPTSEHFDYNKDQLDGMIRDAAKKLNPKDSRGTGHDEGQQTALFKLAMFRDSGMAGSGYRTTDTGKHGQKVRRLDFHQYNRTRTAAIPLNQSSQSNHPGVATSSKGGQDHLNKDNATLDEARTSAIMQSHGPASEFGRSLVAQVKMMEKPANIRKPGNRDGYDPQGRKFAEDADAREDLAYESGYNREFMKRTAKRVNPEFSQASDIGADQLSDNDADFDDLIPPEIIEESLQDPSKLEEHLSTMPHPKRRSGRDALRIKMAAKRKAGSQKGNQSDDDDGSGIDDEDDD